MTDLKLSPWQEVIGQLQAVKHNKGNTATIIIIARIPIKVIVPNATNELKQHIGHMVGILRTDSGIIVRRLHNHAFLACSLEETSKIEEGSC